MFPKDTLQREIRLSKIASRYTAQTRRRNAETQLHERLAKLKVLYRHYNGYKD